MTNTENNTTASNTPAPSAAFVRGAAVVTSFGVNGTIVGSYYDGFMRERYTVLLESGDTVVLLPRAIQPR